jgi:hypothetical protein
MGGIEVSFGNIDNDYELNALTSLFVFGNIVKVGM